MLLRASMITLWETTVWTVGDRGEKRLGRMPEGSSFLDSLCRADHKDRRLRERECHWFDENVRLTEGVIIRRSELIGCPTASILSFARKSVGKNTTPRNTSERWIVSVRAWYAKREPQVSRACCGSRARRSPLTCQARTLTCAALFPRISEQKRAWSLSA